jgi:hypothetical protein
MVFLNHKTMKNILLTSAFFLTTAFAFAQLTVKPNGATSSYLYVKNEVLFVEEDVVLTKNPAGDTEASIYLRNEGQLIQGGVGNLNDGTGLLSVQQNSPSTNAFAYRYWCSPVGNPNLPGTGSKNSGLGNIYEDTNTITGEGTKATPSASTTSYNGYSDPLTISSRWIYTHKLPGTEAEGNYTHVNGYEIDPGYGFTMKGVNEGTVGSNTANVTLNQTYEFRGRPNSGSFAIDVLGPSGGTAMMTLTGNPYPSAMDLNKLFYDLPENNLLSAIWYYDEDRSVMSHLYSEKPFGYGTWVPGAEDPYTGGNPAPATYPGTYTRAAFYIWNASGTHGGTTVGNGSTTNAKRFAPIGQGFMFVGSGAGLVAIKNEYRVFQKEGVYSTFQRPESESSYALSTNNQGPSLSTAPYQLDRRQSQLRLYVVFDDALTRDLLLAFSPQATDGYDRGRDGLSPLGLKSDAYFPISSLNLNGSSERLPYTIQSTNFDHSKQIPITFKLHKTSQIEVRAVEEIRKPYEKAYLYDQLENTYRPLDRAHSLAGTFTLPAGLYEDRFFIVFRARNLKPEGMDTKALIMADVTVFQNNRARQLEVSNPEGYTLKSASVYDMSGKLVISENNLGDSNRYSFYTGNLSDGVYLVKLVTSDDIIVDYKAVVMNK